MQDEHYDVAWTSRAGKDLDAIFEQLETKFSTFTAQTIISDIFHKVHSLENNPERNPLETNIKKANRQFRYVLVKKYRIVYEFTACAPSCPQSSARLACERSPTETHRLQVSDLYYFVEDL